MEAFFSDNESLGFCIGAMHSHPNGTTFSPADVYQLYQNYIYLTRDPNITSDQLAYYRNNAFLMAATTDYTYKLTLHDWAALEQFAINYNDNAAAIIRQYQTDLRNGDSSEQALLNAVGKAINLYKADSGSKLATPRAKDAQGDINDIPYPPIH